MLSDNNNNDNYPTTALLIHYNIHSVQIGICNIFYCLKEVSFQQGCIICTEKNTCLIQEGGLKNGQNCALLYNV